MNGYDLLRRIEAVRPQVGSLIQTILEPGVVGVSGPSGVLLDESGSYSLSVRTIVRAMEVLNDYAKTADYAAPVGSKELHAYYVVESAVRGEYVKFGSQQSLLAGEPE